MHSRSIRQWRNHLDAENTPDDLEIHVGDVVKTRTSWKVMVIPRLHRAAQDYSAGHKRWSGWGTIDTGWYSHYGWAIVADKPRGKKTILALASSQRSAIDKAIEILDAQRDAGHSVTYAIDDQAVTLPAHVSPKNVLADLLDKADGAASGTIGDLEHALTSLDEVINLIPILRTKRDDLAKVKAQRTLGLLTPQSN